MSSISPQSMSLSGCNLKDADIYEKFDKESFIAQSRFYLNRVDWHSLHIFQ